MKRGDITTWYRLGDGLFPRNQRAQAALETVDNGAVVRLQLMQDRNLAQLRAYYAMLNRVVAATGRWPSADALSFQISLDLKSGHPVIDTEGRAHWQPDSRSVSAMPQDIFDELFRNTEQWLIDTLGCHPDDLRADAA
jgi:hypothetical protein